ncbi:conidial hydrophobin Hyp1/RodA [Penicillium waksmanii]|uniref:conidial hydrophobin Hyp1/RodA n=1 Tax=Penicillium waksmanii TaxID=69791 RepID=UPI0025471A8E|nr:conidial hydrophobin Hyp1/RodA [Penicillium waksmanii]KAJ5994710.1 conidial hydrophobin Hyp1/RodA [Penicillium waksmanii]
MKFFATALVFAAAALAMPHSTGAEGSGDGVGGGNSNVQFPVKKETTIQQAQAKCGNDAKVNCCNKATYTHDITTANTGPLAGVLQTALGGGPGGDGLGLFGQCNDISANVPVLNVVGGGVDQLVEQKCKQNIACCQNDGAQANGNLVGVALSCVALGSLL